MKIKNKVRKEKTERLMKIFFSIVGAIITMMSVLTSILTWTNKTESKMYKGCIEVFNAIVDQHELVVICVLSLFVLIVIWVFLFTDRCVKVVLDNDRKIEIKRGDLFKQEGVKVIHCHDTFEIKNNEAIIKGSVFEEFLRMNNDSFSQIERIVSGISQDKKKIGETCFIDLKEKGKYVLFAFSKKDGCNVKLSDKEYRDVIKKLWDALAKKNNNNIGDSWVNVVVMGDTRNSLSLKGEKLILYMVQSFIQSKTNRNLRICLKKGQYKNVDLYGLKYIIEKMK